MLTVDMLTDGVDFELAEVEPARVGPQGLGGQPERPGGDGRRPVAALVALALPRTAAWNWPRSFTRA